MKKIVYITLPILLALLAFTAIYFLIIKNEAKGALQVTSDPKSNVFLNGKLLGQTPLCKCDATTMIPIGDYTIKIVPLEGAFSPFENKITIINRVLTAIDRNFQEGVGSNASIITLVPLDDKKALQLLVLSFPANAKVFLDNNEVGITPLLINNPTASDHELRLEKDGYEERIIRIKTVAGYKHSSTIFMGIEEPKLQETPIPSSSAAILKVVTKIVILDTPTGFLRVREKPSINALEVTRVTPSQSFELIEEQIGWYNIKVDNEKSGWISSQYAKKE